MYLRLKAQGMRTRTAKDIVDGVRKVDQAVTRRPIYVNLLGVHDLEQLRLEKMVLIW